jgi:2-keto-3-deoxy-L-rhamnonate aldolase RhmA
MKTIINSARARLEAGEVSVGVGLRVSRTVDIAKAMKTAGYDWLFIDLEHSPISIDTAVQISVAALDVGITPLVRVPWMEHWVATRVLDGGALGIVMPHVDTADQAREVVDRLKYPPLGHRSVAGGSAVFDFERVDVGESIAAINASTLVTVMIETPQAVANADEIAAVDGVDVLLIGTGDLTTEMGIPGQPAHERIVAAYETVIAACHKHGKWAGMGGAYAEPELRRYIGMGVRMVLASGDLGLMMEAGSAMTKLVRGCV